MFVKRSFLAVVFGSLTVIASVLGLSLGTVHGCDDTECITLPGLTELFDTTIFYIIAADCSSKYVTINDDGDDNDTCTLDTDCYAGEYSIGTPDCENHTAQYSTASVPFSGLEGFVYIDACSSCPND